MNATIVISGINEAEKAAKEILAHVEAIRAIQRNVSYIGADIQVVLDSKEEAASGN